MGVPFPLTAPPSLGHQLDHQMCSYSGAGNSHRRCLHRSEDLQTCTPSLPPTSPPPHPPASLNPLPRAYNLFISFLQELTATITSLDDFARYSQENDPDLRGLSLDVMDHMSFEREALRWVGGGGVALWLRGCGRGGEGDGGGSASGVTGTGGGGGAAGWRAACLAQYRHQLLPSPFL